MQRSGLDRSGRRRLATFLTVLVAATSPVVFATPASADIISNPGGPLTSVEISPDLNCDVAYLGDSSHEFFGDTACATLLATGGTLYGPEDIPAGGSASPRTTYTEVSQTSGGSGTSASPYIITTVVNAGTSGLQIRQVDSYVAGQETYRTDIAVTNTSRSSTSAVVYKAADCYLQDSDEGFGVYSASTGAVSCVTSLDPGARIEQFYPLTAGSNWVESDYDDVWSLVGSQQPFPDECRQCANFEDNGMGLSWSIQLAAGATSTLSHLTNFSPLGNVPLDMAKTAQNPQTPLGGTNSYTITLNNPNSTPVTIASISDELPAGFAYLAGSTTGATTTDPTVAGSTLTWDGPFEVAAGASLTLTLGVNVGSTPGTFLNQASAATEGVFTVVPTGPTAPVTVGSGADYGGCSAIVSDITPGPGQSIVVDGSGAAPNTAVTATIGAATVGSGTSDLDGRFSFTATIPGSTSGSVVMTISCGPASVASVSLTVSGGQAPGGLPRTGASNAVEMTAIGLLVISIGGLALLAGRRRWNAQL